MSANVSGDISDTSFRHRSGVLRSPPLRHSRFQERCRLAYLLLCIFRHCIFPPAILLLSLPYRCRYLILEKSKINERNIIPVLSAIHCPRFLAQIGSSLLMNTFFEIVIFLYLADNETSWLVRGPAGFSVLLNFWKISRAVDKIEVSPWHMRRSVDCLLRDLR